VNRTLVALFVVFETSGLAAPALAGGLLRTVPEAPPSAAASGPPSSPSVLGRSHIWLKVGRTDLDDDAGDWGIDRIGYLAIEGYAARKQGDYFGLEFGKFDQEEAISPDGDQLRGIDSYWLEFNGKRAFGLAHGLSLEAGGGGAVFSVDGAEVSSIDGEEVTDPLADVGFGLQFFGGFTWRAQRLLMGVDLKYQWAFDIIEIDYSNLRVGFHLGVAF
jgi:hypothetical protein